jgi:hypothetical protein
LSDPLRRVCEFHIRSHRAVIIFVENYWVCSVNISAHHVFLQLGVLYYMFRLQVLVLDHLPELNRTNFFDFLTTLGYYRLDAAY